MTFLVPPVPAPKPPASNFANVTVTGNGAMGTAYTIPWTGAGSAGMWNNSTVTIGTTPTNALKVSGDADIQGNLTVHGTNVTEILAKIQERLAILVPDPKLLARYEALREAYDHYRTLEALCVNTDSEKG